MSNTTLDTMSVRQWKQYPEYRPVRTETLSKLPTHWRTNRLKFVTRINPEVLGEDTHPDYELQYIDISNVDSLGRIHEEQTFRFEDAPSRARRRVRHGDVIISTVRTYLRAIATIENPPENLLVSTGFAALRAGKEYDPRFLFRLVQSNEFVDSVVNHSEGVGYPAINPTELGGLPVWLPPLPEQRAIAAFLDRETARIDALIGHKERLIALLEEKRQAVISHAVTRGLDPGVPLKDSGFPWLGMVPKHWEVKRLKYSVRFLNYRRIPLSAEERGGLEKIYPYYGASGIIDQVDRYLFDEPLILLGEDGANLLSRSTPLAFIATGKYWVNNHAHILKPKSGQLVYWVERLNSISYEPFVSGSAQPKLTIDALGSIEFATPEAQEQAKIANYIEEQDAKLSPVMSRVRDGIDRLQEYRTALISAAVTGQIDVRGEVTP